MIQRYGKGVRVNLLVWMPKQALYVHAIWTDWT